MLVIVRLLRGTGYGRCEDSDVCVTYALHTSKLKTTNSSIINNYIRYLLHTLPTTYATYYIRYLRTFQLSVTDSVRTA